MHIVTGMLIAGLLRKGKTASLLPMLRSGPVRTDHVLPGRVRFRVPTLSADRAGAELISQKLPTLEGVDGVDVNPATGSVLIRYREDQARPELLFAAIVRLLGLEKQLEETPSPTIVKELRSMMGSLNHVVHDRTGGMLDFSSALLVALALAGTAKLLSEGKNSLPNGFTMLWWGLHQLLGHGEE